MHVTVIGSEGFLGRHLSSYLEDLGYSVSRISSRSSSGINPVSGLFDPTSSFSHTDVVVYLSQSPHYRDIPNSIPHLLAVNHVSAVHAALLSHKAGARKFIYFSTGTVYSNSFDPIPETFSLRSDNWYAQSKIYAERSLLKLRDLLDIVIVRPFGIYGPNQVDRLIPNLISSVLSGTPITLQPRLPNDSSDGGLHISFSYIDDAVRITKAIITDEAPSIINLSGSQPISIKCITDTIAKLRPATPVSYHTAPYSRSTDLISDVSLLSTFYTAPLISFEEGLVSMLNAAC